MEKESIKVVTQLTNTGVKLLSLIGSIILALVTVTDFLGNFILFHVCNIDLQYIQLNDVYGIIAGFLGSCLLLLLYYCILYVIILKRKKIITKVLCGLLLCIFLSILAMIYITITENIDIEAWLSLDSLYIICMIGVLLFGFTLIAQACYDMIIFLHKEINIMSLKNILKHLLKHNSKKLICAGLFLLIVYTFFSYDLKSEVAIFDKQTSNIEEYVNEIPNLNPNSKYAIIAEYDNKYIIQEVIAENDEQIILNKEQFYIMDMPTLEIKNSNFKSIENIRKNL